MALPLYVKIYTALTVVFLALQCLALDAFIVAKISSVWMVLLVPFDGLVFCLLGLVLRNSATAPRLILKESTLDDMRKQVVQGNSSSLMSVAWACYLCNLSLKMFMLFSPAKSMSVFDSLGPNMLINSIRLTPVIFFLLYTVATHRAPEIQKFLLRKKSDSSHYYADNGDIKQLTLNIALDLLDATELYYFFSYFSASHGLSTEYNHIPLALPLTNVTVTTPFEFFTNTSSGFLPVASSLIADLVSPLNLTDIFPQSSDVCHPISNVAEIQSVLLTKLMIVGTALAGLSSMYAMFVFEQHFYPMEKDDDDEIGDFDVEGENRPQTSNSNVHKRPDRFRWYRTLTLCCVNVPAFMMRFSLWVLFRVSISPMIVKNAILILIFLQ